MRAYSLISPDAEMTTVLLGVPLGLPTDSIFLTSCWRGRVGYGVGWGGVG